jgi:broad specificity phosphatase PhoE
MSETRPVVSVVRHGDTALTHSGQHTGHKDLPLTPDGERHARLLGGRLKCMNFVKVFSSPLQRARRTCELAGFGAVAEIDPNLIEWDFGEYEGLRLAEIQAKRPNWQLFRDGCPGGESTNQVGERAYRVVQRVRAISGDVLIFSSRDFIRVLAAQWLELGPACGRYFMLKPSSLSALSYEHILSEPVIQFWNDDHQVHASQS